ncbi:MFS transporter [Streptomyces sp. NPDC088725]|uniref:MFS transporter n=1 Tax=Streptomyces sp. NPDC088725 TaxID=3365873 RepID=UPI0037F16C7E
MLSLHPGRNDGERRTGGLLAALSLAVLAMAVQQTLVVPVLPALRQDFGTDLAGATWGVTAFLLAASVAAPLLAKLGDTWGRKRVALAALAVQALGGLLTAFAPSLGLFLAGRVLGGIGVAVFPLGIGLVRQHVAARKVPAGIGLLSAMTGAGAAVGMLVPGVVEAFAGGRAAVFGAGTVVVVAALGLIALRVPRDEPSSTSRQRLDYPGAGLLVAALVPLLVAMSQAPRWGWGSGAVVGLFALSAVAATAWFRWERRAAVPLVDLALIGRGSALAANLIAVLLGFGMFAFFTVVATYAAAPASGGYGIGASTLRVGMLLLPCGLAMIVLTPLAARLTLRIGAAATVALGSAVVGGAFGWLLLQPGTAPTLWIASVLFGLGLGIGYSALGTLAIQDVPKEHTSVVSGINGLMRTVGGSLSGAVTSLVLSTHLVSGTGQPSLSGYHVVFAILGVSCLAAAALAISRARTGRNGGRGRPAAEAVAQEAAAQEVAVQEVAEQQAGAREVAVSAALASAPGRTPSS